MKKRLPGAVAVMLTVSAGCATSGRTPITEPVIHQTVAAFHRPESSTFSADGKHLFVSNCASGVYGKDRIFALKAGAGAISKLRVSACGRLEMVNPRFVSGLNTPLGITTLPKATQRFPKGSLFVNTGIYIICDKNDKYISDPKVIGTGVTIIDPDTGKIRGKIDMTPGSAVTQAIGDTFPLPNGIIFDPEGNLYVTDTGEACGVKNTVMPAKGSGGVIRIDHEALDRFAQNQGTTGIHFIPVTTPNGVAYNPHTDSVLVLGCTSGDGESKDSLYAIPVGEFKRTKKAKVLASGLGNMDGAVVTPAGSIIVSVINSQSLVRLKKNGTKEALAFDGLKFMGPSDMKLKTLADGTSILILPEQDHTSPDLWQQRVRVIRLPKGY